jgi:hypothetical protein
LQTTAYALGAVFAAWASYRIHILEIEALALPILEAVVNGEGRAPDQYRIIPYLLLGLIREFLQVLPGYAGGLRYPVLIFDSLFLLLSVLSIRKYFATVSNGPFIWILLLVYPYLMFDGYRPISAFILFLSIITVAMLRQTIQNSGQALAGLFLMILLMSFTRADVALLFAMASLGTGQIKPALRGGLLLIPPLAQYVLSQLLFPEARYFSAVIMLEDNFGGSYLLRSPLTYLLLGLALYYHQRVGLFLSKAWHSNKSILLAMLAYTAALLVIARPNEYRLFLPLLPLLLWLLETQQKQAESSVDYADSTQR